MLAQNGLTIAGRPLFGNDTSKSHTKRMLHIECYDSSINICCYCKLHAEYTRFRRI
jgi:hypothetical protein